MLKKNISIIALLTSFIIWVFYVSNLNSDSEAYKESNETETLSKEIRGIAKVIDGDSLVISNKYKIRLKNIDAPEYQQKCLDKNNYEYFCGKVSKTFLSNLVSNKRVVCKYNKRDLYKRFLSECFFGGKNLSYELIENGMAITYFFDEEDKNLEILEKKAKSKKAGIWQGAFMEPSKYRKANKNKNK